MPEYEIYCSVEKYVDPILLARDFELFVRKECEDKCITHSVWQQVEYGEHKKKLMAEIRVDTLDIAIEIARKVKHLIMDLYGLSEGEITCIVYPNEYEEIEITGIKRTHIGM